MSTATTTDLKTRWQALLAEEPKLRIRDAAARLNASEAELLATDLGNGVTRLNDDFEAQLKRVPELGKTMALTRNHSVVIEKNGVYNMPEFFSHGGPSIGQVVGPEIDLRLFMHAWASAFAVEKEMRGKMQRSLQFFDHQGESIHKIYLRDNDKVGVFEDIVSSFKADAQVAPEVKPAEAPAAENGQEVDAEALLEEWRNMTNTHQFFHMLRKHKVDRVQALKIAEGEFAWRVPNDAHRTALQQAVENEVSIMVFAGNPGCLEIHTGPIKKLMEHGDWYNIMDSGFNLHIDEKGIHEIWVTEKPTEDGLVSAVEVYDKDGTQIVQFFGERKPGRKELEGWRAIIADIKSSALN